MVTGHFYACVHQSRSGALSYCSLPFLLELHVENDFAVICINQHFCSRVLKCNRPRLCLPFILKSVKRDGYDLCPCSACDVISFNGHIENVMPGLCLARFSPTCSRRIDRNANWQWNFQAHLSIWHPYGDGHKPLVIQESVIFTHAPGQTNNVC